MAEFLQVCVFDKLACFVSFLILLIEAFSLPLKEAVASCERLNEQVAVPRLGGAELPAHGSGHRER